MRIDRSHTRRAAILTDVRTPPSSRLQRVNVDSPRDDDDDGDDDGDGDEDDDDDDGDDDD